MNTNAEPLLKYKDFKRSLVFLFTTILAFHLAYSNSLLAPLIVVYAFGLVALAYLPTAKIAWRCGLFVGMMIYAPQLYFFWPLFGPLALELWLVLALWIGMFLLLANITLHKFKSRWTPLLLPFLWTGLEYFRSELYPLRFSWLNIGYAFADTDILPSASLLGVYGFGFIVVLLVSVIVQLKPRYTVASLVALVALTFALPLLKPSPARTESYHHQPPQLSQLNVAGMQLEFPAETEIPAALDELARKHPEAELLVLSEYTLDGSVPRCIAKWCQKNQKFLIIGGKRPTEGNYYNTAFVVGPDGSIVFEQAKAMPIQFFKDGLPAPAQHVWHSPWGKIGICVCYDLSYTRVTDELVRQGAQAIIVPTMDVTEWGRHEHQLHTRIAPMRASEYSIPIFRLASSGISQLVNASGQTIASASFPGQRETVAGRLQLNNPGHLPLDRFLAPFSTGITVAFLLACIASSFKAFHRERGPMHHENQPMPSASNPL